ncbi:unnamed protein product, partial [Owenia fusiformis]
KQKLEMSEKDVRKSTETIVKTFVAGGLAGICAKTTVAPFDRVKILLQAHNQHYKHLGVLSTIKGVSVKEGLVGLYKGNGAQMVRIFPYAAIQFMTYEQYKKILKERYKFTKRPHLPNLIAGSCGGMTAVLITYPLDIIRARLAFQVTGEHMYVGIIHAAKTIFTCEGGLRALYKGIWPTMLGMALYAGPSFYGFDTLKSICLERFPETCGTTTAGHNGPIHLTVPAKVLCGGFAGAFAQTIAYPLDVVRRRMQLAIMLPDAHKFRTMHETLTIVLKEHGIRRGLYRGLSVNYIRVIPMVSMSFTSYELFKQIFGLETGLEGS